MSTSNTFLPPSFVSRHLGISPAQQDEMLSTLGLNSMEELMEQAIPEAIRSASSLNIGPPCNEHTALQRIQTLAEQNQTFRSLIGMGYHGC
ncbi:MAG: hypothetical protein AAGJ35_03430, partial [Myxococcota bacterium]